MKKLLSLLLTLALVFSLTACLAPTPDSVPPALSTTAATQAAEAPLDRGGSYTTKEDVALYIHQYGCLPRNFLTKSEARSLGWKSGALELYAPGRTYTECDIDTMGGGSRGAKRIVFSNDGLVYYTSDHYASFTLLYGEP